MKQALTLREKGLPAGHPWIATSLNNIASLYQALDRPAEAEPYIKRALAMQMKALPAGHLDIATSLNGLAVVYVAQGRFREAEPLARRALAIREKALPPNHPNTTSSLNELAVVYSSQGRPAEALPLLERALAVREKTLPAGHTDIALSLNNLALLYKEQGRLTEAEELHKRALTMYEKTLPAGHSDIALGINNLSSLYQAQGRITEAEPLLKRALAMREKTLPSGHPSIATSLGNLASLYKDQGRLTEVEPLYKRALAMREKALPAGHPDVAMNLNNLASLYKAQGRLAEAEPLHKRALEMKEKALPAGHPDIATSLNNLASLYEAQGRPNEAEPLLKRALEMTEKALPAGHPDIASSLNNLGSLYQDRGRLMDAEQIYKRALTMREKALPAGHPDIADSLNNLADLHLAQGRLAEAEPLGKRALELYEKALPAGHPRIAQSFNNLAFLYLRQGRLAEAEPLFRRSLEITEKALPASHPDIAGSLNNFSQLLGRQERWQEAFLFARRATDLLVRRARSESTFAPAAGSARRQDEIIRQAWYFHHHIRVASRLAESEPSQGPALRGEAFLMAQWAAQSEVARALAQTSARFGTGDAALARLVRERQDMAAQWQASDASLSAALAKPPAQRGGADDRARQRMVEMDARIAEIDRRLAIEFPGYFALATPAPLSLVETGKLLGDDEALVVLLAGHVEETFVFAVTREATEWRRVPLGRAALAEKVAALRKGLDIENLKASVAAGQAELFNLGLAHDLYAALLGPIESLIRSKRHLMIVPSGPLTSLPFSLLVTGKPVIATPKITELAAYGGAAWLTARHAVTTLPAVASLKALRQTARSSPAAKPLIGYGDPVFARGGAAPPQTARLAGGGRTRGYASYWHGITADLDALASGLAPLPETADELRAVAQAVGAPSSDLHLGPAATEAAVKRADLSAYRVVYFATHGLVGGEVKGLGEPALALTLPHQTTDFDDGLLTASEIAQLRLNADWVVLSACNTAAGETSGADALSGLARAFFYAGARALLVSHWRVDSDAAVRLTTATFEALRRDPTIGRAEALRRAMLAAIEDAIDPWNAYPGFWGSFFVVGEGGR